MKEIIEDFRSIYRNDKRVFVMMLALFLVSAILFLLPIFNLNPSTPKIWARYADSSGYLEGDWWYLLSFSVLGLVLGVFHVLLGAKMYSKRGRGAAMLFLALSIAISVVGLSYLAKILGEG